MKTQEKASKQISIEEAKRINAIIDFYENGIGYKFAEKIGVTPSTVSSLRQGRFRIHTYAERILAAYPTLNRIWLLTGYSRMDRRNMYSDEEMSEMERKVAEKEKIIEELREQIRRQGAIIDTLLKKEKQ